MPILANKLFEHEDSVCCSHLCSQSRLQSKEKSRDLSQEFIFVRIAGLEHLNYEVSFRRAEPSRCGRMNDAW